MVFALWTAMMRRRDPFHLLLMALTAVVLVLTVVLAAAGAPMAWCLVVLALAPVVTVVGFETVGHRHQDDALAELTRRA